MTQRQKIVELARSLMTHPSVLVHARNIANAIVNDDPGEVAARFVESLRRKAGLESKVVVNREDEWA